MSTPSASTPRGEGRKSADTQPERLSASQTTTIPTRAATRSQPVLAPHEEARPVLHRQPRGRHAAALEQRGLGLRPDQLPDAVGRPHEGGLPEHGLGARSRQVDHHRVQHAPRPPREHEHAVGHEHRLLDIVRDIEDGLARPLPEGEQLLHHEGAGLGIERREGLVHQQHRRVHRERARDAHALPHAARELMRVLVLEAAEAHLLDVPAGARRPLRHGQPQLLEAQLDIGLGGTPGKERELLEHRRGERLARAPLALEEHLPRAGGQEPGDEAEQGGLAAARGTQDGHELLGHGGEGDVLQRDHVPASAGPDSAWPADRRSPARGPPSPGGRHRRRAEAEALDLAGGRLGQLGDEVDPAGRLVAGEPAAHVRGERGGKRGIPDGAVLEHAEGVGADEAARVAAADHPGLEHRGVLGQTGLHLDRRHPDPAHLQHVVVAALEVEIAVGVLEEHVSGSEPLPLHGAPALLVTVPVAGGDGLALDPQLAGGAGQDRPSLAVHQPRLEAGDHLPAGARARRPGPIGQVVVQRLGGAHHVEQLETESLSPALEHRRRQRLAGGDAQAQRAQIEAPRGLGYLEETRVHGGHREEMCRPLGGHEGEQLLGIEPFGNEEGGGAGEGGKVQRVAETEGEEELGGGEDAIVRPDAEDAAPHPLGGVHEIVLAVHGGLGRSGGAGGVAPERDVVAGGVGGLGHREGGGERVLIRLGAGRHHAHRQHGRAARAARGGGEELRRRSRVRHHRPRAAVLHEERALLRARGRVQRHRHRPDADGPPEGLRELRAIGQREQHALLDLHAPRAQRARARGSPARPPPHR